MGTNDFVDGEIAGGDSTDPTLVNTNARGFATSPKAEGGALVTVTIAVGERVERSLLLLSNSP